MEMVVLLILSRYHGKEKICWVYRRRCQRISKFISFSAKNLRVFQ
jgi:hypothetical protein